MAKLDDLKKQCMLLHLNPTPTKNKVLADGTRTKTLSIKDCTHAIQQYYIEERKRMGTYDPSIEKILSFEPMLALQIKNLKPEVQEEIWDDDNDNWLFQEKIDGCFDYNTMITLSDGTELPIGYIVSNKLDVKVKSYNIKTGEIEAKRVVNWFDNGMKDNFMKIRFGNKHINCTDNHRFFDGDGYTEAKNLKQGYRLVWYKPHLSRVDVETSKKDVYFSEHAYDIEVEDNHNYFANGMLVHNCRCLITYSPALGFNFYSRNLSVTDQLPIAYKDNILLPEIDTSKLTFPFVLDSELVPVNKEIDKSGALVPVADTQLNLVSSILSLNSEDSIEIQKTNPMKFMVFDVLFLREQPLFGKELSYRLGVLGVLYKYLRDAGFPIEIPAMRGKGQSKRSFYDSIVQAGGEGVIAKRLSDPYETKSERSGSWAKIKRKVSESVMAAGLGDTVDAFVIGFEPGTPGTANEHLVASLKFGVELLGMDNQPLEDQDGNTVIHHIATVSGLTQELKEAITYIDPFGNVALKPEIYGKVASIDGQDLSSRNMRFAHAVLVCWREDRSADTCRIREDILRKLIL